MFKKPAAQPTDEVATAHTHADVSTEESSSDAVSEASTERDPHQLPSITTESLAKPSHPVLYLPPLLSSLPPSYPHIEPPVDLPPLHTETRLPNIDPASLSLHKALHHFKPRPGYADLPYADAFNWNELSLPEDDEREWYIVAFRSRRKDGSDGSRESPFYRNTRNVDNSIHSVPALYEADRLAHEEAVMNGGVSYTGRRPFLRIEANAELSLFS